MPANLENSAVFPRTGGHFPFQFQRKAMPKNVQTTMQIVLISHAGKVMLKILQARSRKGRGTRDQIAHIHWLIKKAREFKKKIYFSFIDYAKAIDCVDHY